MQPLRDLPELLLRVLCGKQLLVGADNFSPRSVELCLQLLQIDGLCDSALTVDLGNAFMEKRERQKDTDLATLAGAGIVGANLPATSSAGSRRLPSPSRLRCPRPSVRRSFKA